jgi:TetR/AcrR family transcriptional regulator of autoinduction and epiphytic fitness
MRRTRPAPVKTKQQIVSEFRREAILDAARSVFARKGFALGIMDEIAREAGIAKGTIYLYFRSKNEVYKALLEHDMKLLQKSTLERIDAAGTLKEKIHEFLLERLENAESKKEFFRIMDSERANLSMTRRQYRDFLHEPVQRLAAAMDAAARKGQIRRTDTEKAAWLIVDVARGSIQRRLLGESKDTTVEDAAFLLEFVWASLTAKQKN